MRYRHAIRLVELAEAHYSPLKLYRYWTRPHKFRKFIYYFKSEYLMLQSKALFEKRPTVFQYQNVDIYCHAHKYEQTEVSRQARTHTHLN